MVNFFGVNFFAIKIFRPYQIKRSNLIRIVAKTTATLSAVLLLLTPHVTYAAEYPSMEGVWTGHIRVVTSDASGQLSTGGAIISETDLTFTVDYQDGETFIGRSTNSTVTGNSAALAVWGTIRSNGEEAMFITGTGGNGLIWFESPTTFEYCYTSLTDDTAMAFCAKLTKQE